MRILLFLVLVSSSFSFKSHNIYRMMPYYYCKTVHHLMSLNCSLYRGNLYIELNPCNRDICDETDLKIYSVNHGQPINDHVKFLKRVEGTITIVIKAVYVITDSPLQFLEFFEELRPIIYDLDVDEVNPALLGLIQANVFSVKNVPIFNFNLDLNMTRAESFYRNVGYQASMRATDICIISLFQNGRRVFTELLHKSVLLASFSFNGTQMIPCIDEINSLSTTTESSNGTVDYSGFDKWNLASYSFLLLFELLVLLYLFIYVSLKCRKTANLNQKLMEAFPGTVTMNLKKIYHKNHKLSASQLEAVEHLYLDHFDRVSDVVQHNTRIGKKKGQALLAEIEARNGSSRNPNRQD